MKRRRIFARPEFPVDPGSLKWVRNEESLWHETPEDVAEQLDRGEQKARLLGWVRRHMRSKLTARERQCIELHYFKGLTYREAAKRAGVHPSVVHRGVKRGLAKLRRQLERGRTRARLMEPPKRTRG
jgi:RNA polymerase sigma factor (sigma-70 family)